MGIGIVQSGMSCYLNNIIIIIIIKVQYPKIAYLFLRARRGWVVLWNERTTVDVLLIQETLTNIVSGLKCNWCKTISMFWLWAIRCIVMQKRSLSLISLSGTHCGFVLPPVLISVSNNMSLSFQSDARLADRGFSATWEAVYPEDLSGKTLYKLIKTSIYTHLRTHTSDESCWCSCEP